MWIFKKNQLQGVSIKYNIVMNIILNLSNLIFPLVSFPYITRILGVENLGKINFFNTIGSYAVMLAGIGISTYGIRACALRRNDRKELSRCVQELFFIKIISTSIIIICLIGSFMLISQLRQEPMIFCIECIYIIVYIFNLDWFFSGIEQYSYITKRAILVRTFCILSLFVLVKTKNDYIFYAFLTILPSIISTVINLIYARKYISFKIFDKHCYNIKQHIYPSFTLFGAILAVSVYTSLDTIMLGLFCGDIEVGFYTVAVKVKTILLVFVNSISTVLFPRLSYYVELKLENQYQAVLKKSISVIVLLSLALTAFFIIEADDSILILSGKEYLPALKGMVVLMPILLISGFSNIIGNQVLLPHAMDNCFTKAVSVGALIDVVLNIFLIPAFGFVGAAIATLIAEISQALIQTFYARRYLRKSLNINEFIKTILVTFIVILIVIPVKRLIMLPAIISFMMIWLIYTILYIIGLVLVRSDTFYYFFEILKKALKHRK